MHKSSKQTSIKRRSKILLSFTMSLMMVFSWVTSVFADATWPGNFYVYSTSFNGSNTILAASGQFSNIPDAYQNVPVDSTFTFSFGGFKVFLFRGSWDPVTGTFSSVLNRDLVEIQDSNGNKVQDVTVSNANDANNNTSGNDATVNVHSNKPLDYDTNYKLVLKKNFSKSNNTNPPQIKGAVPADVVIPFKTEALPMPTVTKAELRGNTLTLEGLPKNQNLKYNLAVDGNFQDANWTAFNYTDDTANIEVSGVNLTANSKIKVGYAKTDNSTPTNISDPISVFYASTGSPSFTGAVLSGSNLTLNGLPKNSASLEYRIAADGQNYSDWQNLSVTGTSATVSADGLNLVQGQSIIQVRYKASAPWPASDVTQNSFIYSLGSAVPLIQGTETTLDYGIMINSVSLNTPGDGEANTVAVRSAKGEKLPAPDGMINRGFDEGEDDYNCSGTYGFTLKGAGNGDNNHVKITIPYQLPAVRPADVPDSAVIDDSKVGLYMLTSYPGGEGEIWQYWRYVPATIDTVNHTATVDISGFDSNGKDVILSARFDSFAPRNINLGVFARTATTISLSVVVPDYSPVKSVVITRVNRADSSDVKKVTLDSKDYPGLADPFFQHTIYTDTDPKPGVYYDYTLSDPIDIMGNDGKNVYTSTCRITTDSAAQIVQRTKESIINNLKQSDNDENSPKVLFVSGDSQNSVTQPVALPSSVALPGYGNITWTSDRPDILKVDDIGGGHRTEVYPPVDENGKLIEDGVVVTLTGTIKFMLTDGLTHETDLATDTVTVPLTVKWNIENGAVVIGNEFFGKADNGGDYYNNIDPTININKAAKFDNSIADTIAFKHTTILKYKEVPDIWPTGAIHYISEPQDYVIDANGKTLRADFDGALFETLGNTGGSFTLKNAVIDMNHKSGPILNGTQCKIIFDNVKIINAESCDYGALLESFDSFTANNCEFPSFKVAAISIYQTGQHYNPTYENVDINNCTFDGEGKSGYAILDAYADVNINNSTFKGYKGNVSTGWNSSNDGFSDYASYSKHLDADGNLYHPYKGIPDNSPSSAILVKEDASAKLNGNTITDCDNSVLVWSGEKNFNFLWKKPVAGFIAYPTINGTKVDSANAAKAVDSVLASNTIVGIDNSNQVVVQDAADRYNRTTLLAKASGQIADGIKFEAADSSIELGTAQVTKSMKAVALDQNGDEIKSQKIHWSIVDSPIGVSISDAGVLTVQPFASHGTITVKASIDGTDIYSTRNFAIKVPTLNTAISFDAVKDAITKAKDSNSIELQHSSSDAIAVDNQSIKAINDANKPMLLTSAANIKFLLKPSDLKLGASTLGNVQQLQMSSTTVDEATKNQLNSNETLSGLSGGSFSLATVPFKLSAMAILNDGDQQQITSFNNAITVTLPAPSAMKLEANQTLRACRFNTDTGVWEDKGEALLKDGYITFNTKGFSYWTVMVKTLSSNSAVSNPATGNNSNVNSTTNSNAVTTENANSTVVAAQNTNGSISTNANSTTSSTTSTNDSTTSANDTNSTSKAAETNNSAKAIDKSIASTNENKSVNATKSSTKQLNFITWILAALGLLLIIRIVVVMRTNKKRKEQISELM